LGYLDRKTKKEHGPKHSAVILTGSGAGKQVSSPWAILTGRPEEEEAKKHWSILTGRPARIENRNTILTGSGTEKSSQHPGLS